MAEFDPDAFLKDTAPAAPAASAFDPDAFLKGDAEAQSRARIEGIKARLDKARTEAGGEAGYKDIATDSFAGSLQRPVGGAISAAIGGLTGSDPGSSFTERYKASVENENERMTRAEKERGVLGTLVGAGASLPLAMATGGGAAATVPKLIGQGAVMGAASGAAQHAESAESATKGALEGGAEGGAAAGVIGSAAKMLPGARRVAATEKQIARGATPEEGKTEARAFFKEMDKGGVAYAQPQTAAVKQGLDDLKATNQYNDVAHAKISDYVKQLDTLVTQPQGAKLTELHNLRSALAKEARGTDASTREASGKVIGVIDDLVHNNAPGINPNNLDVKNGYKTAGQKWRAASMADDIQWREGKAARKLDVSPGSSADAANRGAFKPVLDRATKPGAYNPYTDEQKALLAKIVSGDTLQNTYRNVGRAANSPVTRIVGGLAAGAAGLHGAGSVLGGIGAGSGAGLAAGQGLHGIGAIGDALAARRGQKNIDALLRSISGPSSATVSRADLAEILAAQTAARAVATQGGK